MFDTGTPPGRRLGRLLPTAAFFLLDEVAGFSSVVSYDAILGSGPAEKNNFVTKG